MNARALVPMMERLFSILENMDDVVEDFLFGEEKPVPYDDWPDEIKAKIIEEASDDISAEEVEMDIRASVDENHGLDWLPQEFVTELYYAIADVLAERCTYEDIGYEARMGLTTIAEKHGVNPAVAQAAYFAHVSRCIMPLRGVHMGCGGSVYS